jgi:hypothetical protein
MALTIMGGLFVATLTVLFLPALCDMVLVILAGIGRSQGRASPDSGRRACEERPNDRGGG